MSKIVWISDMDFHGSGYFNISTNLCKGLAEKGHEVKVLGMQYANMEHGFPFSILSVANFSEVVASFNNLVYLWNPDVVIVALDIPQQEGLMRQLLPYKVPYVAITPLENGPLCLPWAMELMQANKVFVISEFGAEECRKCGIGADHIQIGIDTQSWRMPTAEERKATRQALLGVEDDETFVILTVADNQERKHLAGTMEVIGEFKKEVTENFKYVLVTREHQQIGYKLRDLAVRYGINENLVIFERGLPFKELWGVYSTADAFLLLSKAEGLGMPVLEAMACGIPCILSETGALIEHAVRGGAWMIEPEYEFIDSWGNSRRVLANKDHALDALVAVHSKLDLERAVQDARSYVESRTWDIPVAQLDETIRSIVDVKEEQKVPA